LEVFAVSIGWSALRAFFFSSVLFVSSPSTAYEIKVEADPPTSLAGPNAVREDFQTDASAMCHHEVEGCSR
jgi:hypothetical protein